ncbi:hypothetical protein [uncultured Microbacterium sp.]|uniref:hypothetical protein n=1 Tax=uncultured Microbacterium sp. TaxID=191216 RepID=UPI0025D768D2|nr:hypothetical protein [uncultured Microbacterium sp.]
MNTPEHDPGAIAHRLTTVGHALHHRLFEQLRGSDLHPKAVRLLRAIDGRGDAPEHADRLARGGKRLDALVARGLAVRDGDDWRLTAEGRVILERAEAARAALLDGIPAEDLESLTRTLDLLTERLDIDDRRGPTGRGVGPGPRGGFGPRAFGPRAFGPRDGSGPRGDDRPAFGPNLHHGFRSGERPSRGGRPTPPGPAGPDATTIDDAAHRCGHDTDPRPERAGRQRRHESTARAAQHAFERGFDAGFSRGRSSATPA